MGAKTGVDNLTYGGTLLFQVDNTYPGGEPRSPGYWKNWNRVTGGGQADNADRNGGYQNGYWLLEDVLNPTIGGGISWDDIQADNITFKITKAAVAVDILDQRDIANEGAVSDGPKNSNDAAYTLAMHLLAAQLNFGAGARTCDAAHDAALAGEQLLDKINFIGTGSYLLNNDKKVKTDYNLALQLANTLAQYNNGLLCSGPAVSFVHPLNAAVVKGSQAITVNVLSTAPVTHVEFFVDGVSIKVDPLAADGWSISWDTNGVADGSHVLKAVATNSLAQTGSADVSVMVDNVPDQPAVTITSPVDGATVSGSSVDIIANVTPATAVGKVEVYVNGVSIGVDADTTNGWSVAWNLAEKADGPYTLHVIATTSSGTITSPSISVNLHNVQAVPITINKLTGSSLWIKPNATWEARATVVLNPSLQGALVTASWGNGTAGTCTTGKDGTCTMVLPGINKKVSSITFKVTNVVLTGTRFDPGVAPTLTVNIPQ
jgi:hypothetical protein